MDTGENKLNAEMMKKLYEEYKNTKKKKLDEFNEAARKIISDKEYPEAEEVLKLVEDTLIADNHERRIHDPSICKYRGKQVLHSFFDEPYPVMMPEDVKTMRGMSDEIIRKIQEDVSKELGEPPRPTITIDSIPDYDKQKVLLDILDTDAPDRNGRIWKREFVKKILNNQAFIIAPRGQKTWLWLKLLEIQKSYEINLVQSLDIPPSTKVDLKSVIHMRWPKQDLSNLKARDFRYGKMWHDQKLINYATGDVSHIDTVILDFLDTFGPDINSGYGLSTPNLNDIDKKKLERVIKRRKKK